MLAGFFSLLSFFFDQQVVQYEGKVRSIETEMIIKENEYHNLSMRADSSFGLSQRTLIKLNEYQNNSTLPYKFVLLTNISQDQIEWLGLNQLESANSFNYQFLSRLYNLNFYFHNILDEMYSYTWDADFKDDKDLEKRIELIINSEQNLYESYFEEWEKNKIISVETANKAIEDYFFDLSRLENLFEIFADISFYYENKASSVELQLEEDIKILEKMLIRKNYFILFSILMQIVSLFFLLMLFRTIVKKLIKN